MIGLLFLVLFIILTIAKGFAGLHEDNERRQRSIDTGRDFYVDRYGHTRHVDNDEMFYYVTDSRGHVLEKNSRHHTVKDVTAEQWRLKAQEFAPRIEEAKANGEKFIVYDDNYYNKPNYPTYIPWNPYGLKFKQTIEGKIYKNVENGGLYVKRKISIPIHDFEWKKECQTEEEFAEMKARTIKTKFAVVMMNLRDAKFDISTAVWGYSNSWIIKENDEQPNNIETKYLEKKVNELNKTDMKGIFVNRSDVWLNSKSSIIIENLKDKDEFDKEMGFGKAVL